MFIFNVDIPLAQHCSLQTYPFPLEWSGAFDLSHHKKLSISVSSSIDPLSIPEPTSLCSFCSFMAEVLSSGHVSFVLCHHLQIFTSF